MKLSKEQKELIRLSAIEKSKLRISLAAYCKKHKIKPMKPFIDNCIKLLDTGLRCTLRKMMAPNV